MTEVVISADNHVNEPPHVFDRVPASMRDRAPKMRKGADIKKYLGLTPISLKTLLIVLAISAGYIIISEGLAQIIKPPTSDFTFDLYRTSVWPPLLWIAVIVFAPAFEEAFFRGFLFEGFRQSRIGIIGAIGITTVVWTLPETDATSSSFLLRTTFSVEKRPALTAWARNARTSFGSASASWQPLRCAMPNAGIEITRGSLAAASSWLRRSSKSSGAST